MASEAAPASNPPLTGMPPTASQSVAARPLVHYLTPRLRIPCRPDLKDLTGAPLNSTIQAMVTCPDCIATLAGQVT